MPRRQAISWPFTPRVQTDNGWLRKSCSCRRKQGLGLSGYALDLMLEDDVGEREDEVDDDHGGDEDAPLLEGIGTESRCIARYWLSSTDITRSNSKHTDVTFQN